VWLPPAYVDAEQKRSKATTTNNNTTLGDDDDAWVGVMIHFLLYFPDQFLDLGVFFFVP
jgi:hypothetical protein